MCLVCVCLVCVCVCVGMRRERHEPRISGHFGTDDGALSNLENNMACRASEDRLRSSHAMGNVVAQARDFCFRFCVPPGR